jgi:hypothetical protein
MGWSGQSRANKFFYAPAPPTPSEWALKPPSWALVHKTTYAPMIYTALFIMFWMHAYPLLGEVGGGWARGGHRHLLIGRMLDIDLISEPPHAPSPQMYESKV